MPPSRKKVPAVFYRTSEATEPVRDWLKGLGLDDRKTIGTDIQKVEFGWPLGLPVCRSLGKGLWEVRSSLARGRIARVLFCFADDRTVLLHGFMKKTQKTPKPDLDIALKRMKDVVR